MKIINRSRKIIGINGEPLLPGETMELPKGYETHPSICDYLAKGIVVDAQKDMVLISGNGISDLERKRIAEEAIAWYKKQQEEKDEAGVQMEKEAEIRMVKAMRKPELLIKAAGMGLAVNDDDTVDVLKEKIITALA